MSRRCGKGKGYRPGSIRRNQLDVKKDVTAMVIAENLSLGLGRPTKENKPIAYTIAKSGMDMMTTARQPFPRLSSTSKGGIGKVGILRDKDLYNQKLDVTGGNHSQPMVRIGTVPSRMFPVTEDGVPVTDEKGRQVFARVPEKPWYAIVGLAGSRPKDGGK